MSKIGSIQIRTSHGISSLKKKTVDSAVPILTTLPISSNEKIIDDIQARIAETKELEDRQLDEELLADVSSAPVEEDAMTTDPRDETPTAHQELAATQVETINGTEKKKKRKKRSSKNPSKKHHKSKKSEGEDKEDVKHRKTTDHSNPKRRDAIAQKTLMGKGKHSKIDVGGEVKRPHRFRPGIRALREVRHYQKTTELLIPRAPCARLIRYIVDKVGPETTSFRMKKSAIEAICQDLEAFGTQLFSDSLEQSFHAGRVTIFPKDQLSIWRLRHKERHGDLLKITND